MSKVISQLGLNYQTIAKHAGVESGKHYFRKTRFGSIVCDEHYSVIMRAALKVPQGMLTDSDVRDLSAAHGTIVEKIAATDEYLDQLKDTRKQFAYAEAKDRKAFSAARLFTIQEFHSYISSIFTSPMEARNNLDSLLAESDNKDQLVLAISKNPDMLGELKERGIVAKLLKPEEANKVNTNLSHFTERLKQYIAEVRIMSEIEPKLDSNYYGKQISIIDKEIESIKASLPNKEEIELIEEISQIESKSIQGNSNKLDNKLFKHGISELFKEDRQVDLLLNWQMHQAKLEEYKLEKVKSGSPKGREYELEYNNRQLRQKSLQSQQHQRLERLNFNDVSKALSVSDYESIFCRYAQVINPDGKIVKRGSSIGCGSLNMNLQNGLWNRFSTGDYGNIFGLVSLGMRVNKLEALEVVADHAGIKPETNGYFRTRNTHERYNRAIENNEYSVKKELRDDWLQTNTRGAKAFEPDNDLKFMLKSNKITDI